MLATLIGLGHRHSFALSLPIVVNVVKPSVDFSHW